MSPCTTLNCGEGRADEPLSDYGAYGKAPRTSQVTSLLPPPCCLEPSPAPLPCPGSFGPSQFLGSILGCPGLFSGDGELCLEAIGDIPCLFLSSYELPSEIIQPGPQLVRPGPLGCERLVEPIPSSFCDLNLAVYLL